VQQLPGLLRLAAGVAIVIAVIGQFVYSAERGPVNFFNFFGYFTTQSNIILMVAFFASAYFILSRKTQPSWVVFLRAAATTVIILVGLVYNTLLSGASLVGSFDLRWSSNILHVIIPIVWIVVILIQCRVHQLPTGSGPPTLGCACWRPSRSKSGLDPPSEAPQGKSAGRPACGHSARSRCWQGSVNWRSV
jgi:hypothetical protein